MKLEELDRTRNERWRLTPETAVESSDDLVEFVRDMQWCFIVPQKNTAFPSFQGAVLGRMDRKITTASHAAFQMALKDFWRSAAVKHSFVQVNSLARAAMIMTKDVCRKIARIYLPDTVVPKALKRTGVLNRLEMEVLDQVHHQAMSKRQLRHALDMRGKSGSELENALRTLRKKMLVLQAGVDEDDALLYHSTVRYLRITEASRKKVQPVATGEFLIQLYMKTVVADTRSGIKSFFRGVLQPQEIDSALYRLLLQSHLKVDPDIIINNKKAIIAREFTNGDWRR